MDTREHDQGLLNGEQEASSGSLSNALLQGLDLPVAALRASMEALAGELARKHVADAYLTGPLDEVRRIGRNVQDLMEYTTPPTPAPLRCSAGEILVGALKVFDEEQRGRVEVARDPSAKRLFTDAPIVVRSLRRVLENAFEAQSERVLVRIESCAEGVRFNVVNLHRAAFEPGWSLAAFQTSKPNHLGLGLTIARRDLRLLGGELEIHPSGQRLVRTSLLVPQEREVR